MLELLCAGVDRPDIAARLSLSPATVSHYVEALMHGYGAATVTVLVAMVLGARLRACQESLAAVEERRGERRST